MINFTADQLAQTIAHIYAVHDALHASDESAAFDFCMALALDEHAQGGLTDDELVARFAAHGAAL